jgi:hypothetical protein
VVAIAISLRDYHDVTTHAARCGVPFCTLHSGAGAAVSAVNRRLIRRLLLVFALLWSQQAALSHTVSHLLQESRATTDAAGKPAKSLFKDESCSKCLAHAQFFSTLGSAQRPLVATKPAPLRLFAPATPDDCIITVCMFQSRAPPQA